MIIEKELSPLPSAGQSGFIRFFFPDGQARKSNEPTLSARELSLLGVPSPGRQRVLKLHVLVYLRIFTYEYLRVLLVRASFHASWIVHRRKSKPEKAHESLLTDFRARQEEWTGIILTIPPENHRERHHAAIRIGFGSIWSSFSWKSNGVLFTVIRNFILWRIEPVPHERGQIFSDSISQQRGRKFWQSE